MCFIGSGVVFVFMKPLQFFCHEPFTKPLNSMLSLKGGTRNNCFTCYTFSFPSVVLQSPFFHKQDQWDKWDVVSQTMTPLPSSSTYLILFPHISLFFIIGVCAGSRACMQVYLSIPFHNMDSFIYFLRNKECHRPEWLLRIVFDGQRTSGH